MGTLGDLRGMRKRVFAFLEPPSRPALGVFFLLPVFSPVDLSLGTAMNLELLGELFSDPCVDTGAATLRVVLVCWHHF